jgi:glyoxylase-like metal-dependent hydrolase (beta-lactamase superfamily II)
MKVRDFVFGPFATNCYVVSEGAEAWIIDPACATEYEQQALLRYIETKGLTVTALIATHGHLDHLWGAAWACRQWRLPVLLHEADIPMAQAMQEQYDLFGVRAKAEPFPMKNLTGIAGLTVKRSYSETVLQRSGLSSVELIETPGHTPGSVCLYWKEDGILLSGDTLFCMGYGRTDLPGGNMAELIASLECLFALPPATRVFPGHGESTTIGAERR